MKTKELLETIDKFFTSRVYDYALMINGPWGCGKTYFVKNELIPHLDNHEKHPKTIYISLYGIDDVRDITNALIVNTISTKANNTTTADSKRHQIGSFIAGNALKTILNKNEISIDGIDNILEKIIDYDNTVILFDDLERCNCDINEVLGYINHFVEHTNASVIIIANEEEIGRTSNDKNYELQMMLAMDPNVKIESEDGRNNGARNVFSERGQKEEEIDINKLEVRRAALFNRRNKYLTIKEKVIGQTIEYEPEIETIFTQLTNRLSNDILRKNIIEEMDNLTRFAENDSHINIRTFQFFLEKVNGIFDLIDNKYTTTHREIVQYCYRSSIKYMSGKKLPKWDREIGLQLFGNFWDIHDYINGFRFIDDYIQGNAVDNISVNQLLENYENQIVAEGQLNDDPFKKLQDWSTAEDEHVKSWLISIKEKLDNNEYRLILFPRILQYIVNFEARNVFRQECSAVWQSMKRSAQTIKEEDLIQLSNGDFFSAQEDEKVIELFATRQKELVGIISSRVKTSEENTYKQAVQDSDKWAENLYELSTSDAVVRGHSFMYWLDANCLIKLILSCNNEQLLVFRRALHALYKSHIYYQNKADDLDHLQDLLNKIQKMDRGQFGEIKNININWLIGNLEDYIKELIP